MSLDLGPWYADHGVDVTYTPLGGVGFAARGILTETAVPLAGTLSTERRLELEVRKAEVPTPQVDDRVTISGAVYQVTGVDENVLLAIWLLTLERAQ